ncbi:MAG TPA: M1 family aminopeptidase [Thermoanaerobaculia bacterium]|nr:M1 family aminopeptidase [Thermoanaerobaculia bacterium]
MSLDRSRRLIRSILALALTFASAALTATETDPTYTALRASRPDGRRVPVQNLKLVRDAFTFTFESGAFHFLAPVEGRTFGAVFLGAGRYNLLPATEGERQHLNLVTGRTDLEVLEDRFDSMVLLFGDATDEEITSHGALAEGPAEPRARKVYEDYLEEQKRSLQINLHIRVLADLLNQGGRDQGTFLAWVDGAAHPPALLLEDPRGIGSIAASFGLFGGETTGMIVDDDHDGGAWYLSVPRGVAKRGVGRAYQALVDAQHYEVETTIGKGEQIDGVTTIRFTPLVEGIRVLPIHIMPKLRLTEPMIAGEEGEEWTAVALIQEEIELRGMARLFRNEAADADAAVVFDEPLRKGASYRLRLSYEGKDVLRDAGDTNYYVGARESWYPNFGAFVDVARYDLKFRVPKDRDLVSIGALAEEKIEGTDKISIWKSEQPVRVAGFNYGKFRKIEREDKASGLTVQVYTNPGTPDFIRELNDDFGMGDPMGEGSSGGLNININTRKLADSAMVDAVNMARIGTAWFGPLPKAPVAITQQSQMSFGQSWPNLIFLPYMAFIDGTTRAKLFGGSARYGLSLAELTDFIDTVGAHEMAHQWWGHLIGWESYRDQWLSEGFAEFSAALFLQHSQSNNAYNDFFEKSRKRILEKKPGALGNWEAGPISQGLRLSSRRSPAAYQIMAYSKGAYVLHMLRMMMRDESQKHPDEAFIAMMRDFVSTWSMKNPSTTDFQRAVEKHMTPAMSADGRRSMDWFFDQWVHGTDIPKFSHDLRVEPSAGGKYRLVGTIKQEGVSGGFRSMVPIYADFGKNQMAQLGRVPLVGNSSFDVDVEMKLQAKPKSVMINAMHDILARD